ncbi:MAG TPA: metallophosphoesterase [Steroidobacteraceae bacterium]|nr:metallophosphoesterase [Steroidobacteraceae bacterium]
MKLATNFLGGVAVVLAAVILGGCTPHTRPPVRLPPADAPPGAIRLYAVGDVADCGEAPPEAAMARRTAALVPTGSLVLGLGDMAYPYADAATLDRCYAGTWGVHRATTLAIAGNHDYVSGSARTFRAYFGLDDRSVSDRFVAFTQSLSPDWLLIALDSNAEGESMRRQREWLAQTLEAARPSRANTAQSPRCIAVMWHAPLYSSGWHRGAGEHMRPVWALLDGYGADFVLSGHEHFYEAFEPFDAQGQRRHDGDGMRQFVVGTGGARLHGFWRPPYASRARVLDFGVLQMTLGSDQYAWRFIDTEGRMRDGGTAQCRGSRPESTGSRGSGN